MCVFLLIISRFLALKTQHFTEKQFSRDIPCSFGEAECSISFFYFLVLLFAICNLLVDLCSCVGVRQKGKRERDATAGAKAKR